MKHPKQTGFTIVELLIVVVVIAILAAITIVSYNGITKRATESSIKSELKTAATQLGIAKTETGSYPSSDSDIKKSADISFGYAATPNTFCLQATHPNLANQPFYVTQTGTIQAGGCPAVVATMQAFTADQCSALATFTGANSAAVTSLTDSRGGTTRTYQVAKLADGKCWMLNNLKLGSTTSTINLTSVDSDVTSGFILPQVNLANPASEFDAENAYDTPYVHGPIPGDSGSGATNYGYLYNFAAATAGATRISLPAVDANAPDSICPANWRLPNGGDVYSPTSTNEFSLLNIYMTDTPYTESVYSWSLEGWQPFKPVLSGVWWGAFSGQGSTGYVWVRTAMSSNSRATNGTWALSGSSSEVYPSMLYRANGASVRCLLG